MSKRSSDLTAPIFKTQSGPSRSYFCYLSPGFVDTASEIPYRVGFCQFLTQMPSMSDWTSLLAGPCSKMIVAKW